VDEDSINTTDSESTLKGTNLSQPLSLPTSLNDIDDDDLSLVGEEEILTDKAARPDDAEADPCEWDIWSVESFADSKNIAKVCNGNYNSDKHTRFFNAWRKLLERKYRYIILKSYLRYMRKHYRTETSSWLSHSKQNVEFSRDLEVGLEAITRASNSTWWSWEDGSTLYF
jgi:hypothetical protein